MKYLFLDIVINWKINLDAPKLNIDVSLLGVLQIEFTTMASCLDTNSVCLKMFLISACNDEFSS